MISNTDIFKSLSTHSKTGVSVLFVVLACLMLLFIGASAFMFILNAMQSKYVSEYGSYVAEQELISQQIVTNTLDATSGVQEAFDNLERLRARFDQTLYYLEQGNLQTGLPPMAEVASLTDPLFQAFKVKWSAFRYHITTIIEGRSAIAQVVKHVKEINSILPNLIQLSDEIANEIVKAQGNQRSVYIASRQLLLAQRIQQHLTQILSTEKEAAVTAEQLGKDVNFFEQVLRGMLDGYPALGISKVTVSTARAKLEEVEFLFEDVRDNLAAILDASSQLLNIGGAMATVHQSNGDLLKAGAALRDELIDVGGDINRNYSIAGFISLGISIFVMVLIGYFLQRQAVRRAEQSDDQNRRNQQAILRLLDEMTHLAEGDLTAYATVTEDITGVIADSMNYSIDALRSLVETINQTVVEVSSSSEQTQAITRRLQSSSVKQEQEIALATSEINKMTQTMEEMSSRADESSEVALKSVNIANKGAETVRKNITGMDSVRDTIQETSKRIKRLGESSQQIGEIVALITDIADQTNILALNAAIQASSAGEAGRGFAVVADEVQRLAERAGNATKQISGLVKMIQADTNEAVASMEASTSGVINGAKLAEDAGVSLIEVEAVSKQLADLIGGISVEASEQAASARNISQSMDVIQAITLETSGSTKQTAQSVGKLTELANELRKSVAGFKLPDSKNIETMMSKR